MINPGGYRLPKERAESEHYIIIRPENFETLDGQLKLLGLLETMLAYGNDYIEMLPGGIALFKKMFR
jgi:hypothetical protein